MLKSWWRSDIRVVNGTVDMAGVAQQLLVGPRHPKFQIFFTAVNGCYRSLHFKKRKPLVIGQKPALVGFEHSRQRKISSVSNPFELTHTKN